MVANYDGYTLEQVYTAIMAGKPATLTNAGTAFDKVAKGLTDLATEAQSEVIKVAGMPDVWSGPAAEAFLAFSDKFLQYVTDSVQPISGYKGALDTAASALTGAQTNIEAYKAAAAQYRKDAAAAVPPQTPDEAALDKAAQSILITLAGQYENAKNAMQPVAESPDDLANINTASTDEKNGKKGDEKDDKDDKEGTKNSGGGSGGGGSKDDKKKDDKDKDDKKKDDKDKDGKDDQNKGGGGGGDPPKAPQGGGGGGGEPPKAPQGGGGGGQPPNNRVTPPDPKKDQTPTPPIETPKPPGGGPNGSTPPISDSNRALPGSTVPIVKKDGKEGFDLDKDDRPDIGLDGKPIPGSKLLTKDGGIDITGDGKPDIGKNGEIINGDLIVTGPDRTIGLDLDKDGKPDIAISGQVLPDGLKLISKTLDGVEGIDVDGDGIADIGFDRKPLPGSEHLLVVRDGVTGIDVDGDHKPDIGVDGQILKDAPIATDKHDIKGIDLDGDGKPDIALPGEQKAPIKTGADAITNPKLPELVLTPAPSTPATPNFGVGDPSLIPELKPGVPETALAPQLRYGIGDPGTTLTGGAPAPSATPPSTPLPPSPGTGGHVVPGVTPITGYGPTVRPTTLTSTTASVPPGPPVRSSNRPEPPSLGRAAAGAQAQYLASALGGLGYDDDEEEEKKKTKRSPDADAWDSYGDGPDQALGRPRR